MTYISWATFYEGSSDQAYFDILIPRTIEDIILRSGTRNSDIPPNPSLRLKRGSVEEVAEVACAARDAFQIVFIHADTGGRSLEAGLEFRSKSYCRAMYDACSLPIIRCVTISPRHETEAWVLADPDAVTDALGFSGPAASIGLPASASAVERITNPKAVLENAVNSVRGRRRRFDAKEIFSAVAQRQSLLRLRLIESFNAFEADLTAALADIGGI